MSPAKNTENTDAHMRLKCPDCGAIVKGSPEKFTRARTCPKCNQNVHFTPAPKSSSHATASAGDTLPAEKLQTLLTAGTDACKIEIMQYASLDGSRDVATAEKLFFANEGKIKLKMPRITLRGGSAVVEPGALYFMKGRIEMESKVGGSGGLGGLARGLASKMLSGETVFRPRYTGTGEIYLEPSFGHFLLHEMHGETLIVDKSLFYCSDGGVTVSVAAQKNISSALFGGEGFFQTQVSGSGVCVFASPVPADEVMLIELQDETLSVDGNFALMRTRGVAFTVEKSSKRILGTITGGEGLLQTFSGTGKVWIAPTQAIYDRIGNAGGIGALTTASGSSHTET